MTKKPNTAAALLALVLLSGCAGLGKPTTPATPATLEPIAQQAKKHAVTTAHPLATTAALNMLDQGGSAIDAIIAAQMVLGLVEPQASGVGGGALAMYWDAKAARLSSFDGLAAAPG